ncbi:hypothetical protein J1N35_005204 [Gossypium stocksii]|uniref:Uncharacterized protein n=1 Tax=Gossypium stocksii TaxID=47602 RepID=A0A9D4AIE1_9ROSI|nr:hypothetical protein J1N35_005204 [Gossypium stocksii]
MSKTWSYTGSHLSILMPCPRHGLTLTCNEADAMSYTWSYTSSRINVDAMSKTWCYTSTRNELVVPRLMPCPEQGLTLALLCPCQCHVPEIVLH